MTVRTAVLLYGLVRECGEAATSFKMAFAGVPCDVYMHTFAVEDESSVADSNAGKHLDLISVPEDELRERFGLIDLKVDILDSEARRQACHHREELPSIAVRTLCRYESVKRVFELVGDRLDGYDRVIATRPDVVYSDPLELPHPPEGTIAVPKLPNMLDGKKHLAKMRERNPGSVCEWHHDFFHVARPETIRAVSGFGDEYLNVVAKYPLPSEPYHPDRALAVYLKKERQLKIEEFRMIHGLQRDGWVQMFS